MLEGIFGNKTTEKVLLALFHYGEIHAQAIANDFDVALNPIRAQLDRLEGAGVIVSKPYGRMRIYSFNPKSPYSKLVKEIIRIYYDSIPIGEKERLFTRRRPRRKDKPVL